MLSDSPSPEDLPEAPSGYAALPPSYVPPASRALGEPPAGTTGFGLMGPGPVGPGPSGPPRSPLRPVLAVVAIVALLGTIGLAVWRAGNPPTEAQAPQTSAGGSPSGGSSSAPPTHPRATDFPAALRAFYTQ